MLRRSGNKPDIDAGAPGHRSVALEAIDALYKQEMQANIAALRERRRRVQQEQSVSRLMEYWPVAVGIVLSMFSPVLREIVEPVRPWGMWVVFPFVSIAGRPEFFMGDDITVLVQTLMLYIQFPLEGLLAMIGLRGNVTAKAVAIQVLFLHTLCIIELWLVNGGWIGK